MNRRRDRNAPSEIGAVAVAQFDAGGAQRLRVRPGELSQPIRNVRQRTHGLYPVQQLLSSPGTGRKDNPLGRNGFRIALPSKRK
jgi:hypothetical protein